MQVIMPQTLLAVLTLALKTFSLEDVSRNGKLLNVFNIVTFPNDPCNSGDNYGSCYTGLKRKAESDKITSDVTIL